MALAGGVALTNHFTATGNSGSFNTVPVSNNTANPSASPAASTNAKPDKTVTGAAIKYVFGTVQVSVTRVNGKISSVGLVQATATNGRAGAFTYLQQYAVQSQGSSFANISGATYTTAAFKQALDSAIAKLG